MSRRNVEAVEEAPFQELENETLAYEVELVGSRATLFYNFAAG